MAYFAEVDDSGIVQRVIAVSNEDAPDPAPHNSEPLGQAFIASIGLSGQWVQTSFHGTFRRRFAAAGYQWDESLDAFIEPQPYPSWALDEAGDWQPPTPYPSEGGPYCWDEDTLAWVLIA